MLIRGASSRLLSSYLDNNGVVVVDPVGIDISNNFFLGCVGASVRARACVLACVRRWCAPLVCVQ